MFVCPFVCALTAQWFDLQRRDPEVGGFFSINYVYQSEKVMCVSVIRVLLQIILWIIHGVH